MNRRHPVSSVLADRMLFSGSGMLPISRPAGETPYGSSGILASSRPMVESVAGFANGGQVEVNLETVDEEIPLVATVSERLSPVIPLANQANSPTSPDQNSPNVSMAEAERNTPLAGYLSLKEKLGNRRVDYPYSDKEDMGWAIAKAGVAAMKNSEDVPTIDKIAGALEGFLPEAKKIRQREKFWDYAAEQKDADTAGTVVDKIEAEQRTLRDKLILKGVEAAGNQEVEMGPNTIQKLTDFGADYSALYEGHEGGQVMLEMLRDSQNIARTNLMTGGVGALGYLKEKFRALIKSSGTNFVGALDTLNGIAEFDAEGRPNEAYTTNQKWIASRMLHELLGERSTNISNLDRKLAGDLVALLGSWQGRLFTTQEDLQTRLATVKELVEQGQVRRRNEMRRMEVLVDGKTANGMDALEFLKGGKSSGTDNSNLGGESSGTTKAWTAAEVKSALAARKNNKSAQNS